MDQREAIVRQRMTQRLLDGDVESIPVEKKSAEAGQTFAEQVLRRFQQEWRGDMDIAMRAMCAEALS